MTRDYARKNNSRTTKPRGRQNTRRQPARQKKSGMNGLFWFIAGLAVGALATSLYLSPGKVKELSGDNKNAGVEEKQRPKIDFVFHKLLSQNEEEVPEQELEPEVNTRPQPVKKPEPANVSTTRYFLQVGAFQKMDDANALRAQMLLMNMDASVEKATVEGQLWHRVLIGPFQSKPEAGAVRSRLTKHNVESRVIKRN